MNNKTSSEDCNIIWTTIQLGNNLFQRMLTYYKTHASTFSIHSFNNFNPFPCTLHLCTVTYKPWSTVTNPFPCTLHLCTVTYKPWSTVTKPYPCTLHLCTVTYKPWSIVTNPFPYTLHLCTVTYKPYGTVTT
jgi:hypothetical protein